MNGDFIYSVWWQSLGAVLFGIALVYALYGLTRKQGDEVEEDEDVSTYKANSWEFRAVKKFK
jgi:hypothetical protein